MVMPVAFAPRRQQQAPEAAAAVGTAKKSSTTSTALWLLGLLTASTAITMAVCVPPPALLHKNAYFLALSCFFFAGVGGVMSAVVCMATTTHLRHRHTTGGKLMNVLVAQLVSVVLASFSTTTTALGVLGLAAASTALTMAVCVPPPALHKNAYFLAVSCFFFAGVGGVMSAVVWMATTTAHLRHRHRHATGRKLMNALLDQLASVVDAAFSTKTTMGVLGLAAASTAMNMYQTPRDLDESDYCCHLAISGLFFAGVAAFMAAVREGGQVDK